ncbi:MAG: site-2 protease family protein [Actinomycetota bacterium]|nr:site-2 protease family protein [Actinomycetota bacterium]
MALSGGDGRAAFHRYGPWLLGGGAVLAGIVYEIARRHVVSHEEVVFFLVLVPTIIVHEVSHGVVAYWCGDDTAKRARRLSLNPLRHVDPIGTVLLPILLILTTGSAFGWAKPVPVNVSHLRHPRNQAVLVGLVGPFVNVVIAFAAGFLFRVVATPNVLADPYLSRWPLLDLVLFLLGEVNVIIAVFNLIPIPPLDGSAVLERLLPQSLLPGYYRLRSVSMILVLFLVFWAPGVLSTIFDHALQYWGNIVL